MLLMALAVRLGYVEHTPFKAVNDAGTYNRLASNVAQTGDYDTGSGPGYRRRRLTRADRLFPARASRTSWRSPICSTVTPPATSRPCTASGSSRRWPEPPRSACWDWWRSSCSAPTVALVAMALAALYPVLIEQTGTLVAENLLVVLELAAVWTAVRARRSLHPYRWIAATGVLAGLAALTHQNAILLLIPLGRRGVDGRGTGPRDARCS